MCANRRSNPSGPDVHSTITNKNICERDTKYMYWQILMSAYEPRLAHQAGAYPGFRSMKRLGVFLLPPGWDASPSQGYPPALSSPVPIYTPGWRGAQ